MPFTSDPSAPSSLLGHPYRRLDPRRARNRLLWSVAAGVGVAGGLGWVFPSLSWPVRVVAGWDGAVVTLLALAWSIIWTCDAERTRRRAAAEDPGRTAVWVLVLLSSVFSLFAAAVVLRQAKALAPQSEVLFVGLCLGAVVGAWLLTHTGFTLRYAHLYYRDDAEGVGGLTLPGDEPPDDFDFAYFAFTVGMCFQVSDVVVSSRQIRRLVLFQAMLSFAYNTVILALALNLVFGLLG
jgi:uncharacterized membrane protein